jgi:hypothetical protein
MNLIDNIRKALQGISTQDAMKGQLRSCEDCSFFKNGYCTQVQPPSKILNVYEAQLCIYYTPESVTTGEISQAERETVSSKLGELDNIKNVEVVEWLKKIGFGVVFVKTDEMINPDFETGDLYGWEQVYSVGQTPFAEIVPRIGSPNPAGYDDTWRVQSGNYACNLKYNTQFKYLQHYLPPYAISEIKRIAVMCFMRPFQPAQLDATIFYTDETSTNTKVALTTGRTIKFLTLSETTTKILWFVYFKNSDASYPNNYVIDGLQLIK